MSKMNLKFNWKQALRYVIGAMFVVFSLAANAQYWFNNSTTTNECDGNQCVCPTGWSIGITYPNCTYIVENEGSNLYGPITAQGCLYNGGQSCGPCGESGTAMLERVSCWNGSQSTNLGTQMRCTNNSECIGGPQGGGLPINNNPFVYNVNKSGNLVPVR